jgi:DNA invertase Pin-like site-specific DNA recombinase
MVLRLVDHFGLSALIRLGFAIAPPRHDRLARSTFDLFAIIQRIVDTGAHFRSLAEPWADTSTGPRRLMIAVPGGIADGWNARFPMV